MVHQEVPRVQSELVQSVEFAYQAGLGDLVIFLVLGDRVKRTLTGPIDRKDRRNWSPAWNVQVLSTFGSVSVIHFVSFVRSLISAEAVRWRPYRYKGVVVHIPLVHHTIHNVARTAHAVEVDQRRCPKQPVHVHIARQSTLIASDEKSVVHQLRVDQRVTGRVVQVEKVLLEKVESVVKHKRGVQTAR